jgi:hypothetical protein
MGRADMTRRQFVKRGATITVASTVLASETASASTGARDDSTELLAGTIRRIDSPRSGVIEAADGRTLDLALAPDAPISRGFSGPVDDLTPFVPGDEIVVVVAGWSGSTVTASELQSMYYAMDGSILGVDADGVVHTSAGDLRIPPEVAERDALPDLQPGLEYSAEVWKDPEGEPVAVIVRVD